MFIECDNKKFYKRYIVTGFLFVGILGTLFHFVYDWCRLARLIGLFVPVNESTWEHMKLLFIPMLIYIAICFQYVKKKVGCKYVSDKNSMKIFSKDSKISVNVKNEKNNEICKIIYTGLIGNIVGTWSIPFLFYGYKGILGFEVAWIDISTFFIAVYCAVFCASPAACRIGVSRSFNIAVIVCAPSTSFIFVFPFFASLS